MKIEKGKTYRCVKFNGDMFKDGWNIGNKYLASDDNVLIDDDGEERRVAYYNEGVFELVQEPLVEELLKRIEALESQMQPCPTPEKFKTIADHANAINEVIQNAPKDKTIYVPDGILDVEGDIVNGDRVLHYYIGGWNVNVVNELSTHQQFKLEPCKREDLKTGDVALRRDVTSELNCLRNYCIILDEGYQYWNNKNCFFGDSEWNDWYKVVEA